MKSAKSNRVETANSTDSDEAAHNEPNHLAREIYTIFSFIFIEFATFFFFSFCRTKMLSAFVRAFS